VSNDASPCAAGRLDRRDGSFQYPFNTNRTASRESIEGALFVTDSCGSLCVRIHSCNALFKLRAERMLHTFVDAAIKSR
jgi:hypothetical protein